MKSINYYIGFRDKDTKQYAMSIHECETVTKAVALEHFEHGFAFTETQGVYQHDNGEIVIEQGCKVTVFGDDVNNEFVAAIKEHLNQESVAVEVINSIVTFV